MSDFKPNLFILGVAKSGTTTLHSYLSQIEGICMSDPKEPYFFECEFDRGIEFFRKKYFAHWNGEKIVGESRHRNLYLPYVPDRIKSVNEAPKMIVVLRNPVDRAYSHWWHFYSRGQEKLGFKDAIQADLERIRAGKLIDNKETIAEYCKSLDGYLNGIYRTYVDTGYYHEQISRYLEIFPRENLLILSFNDLRDNESDVIEKLRAFLELSKDKMPETLGRRNEKRVLSTPSRMRSFIKSTGLSKLIPMKYKLAYESKQTDNIQSKHRDQSTIDLLTEHFRPYNERLKELIDFDIDHWDR